MPSSPIDLRSLPGIGRYTAAAVACFAYEQQLAVVDTNIRRVLGRILLGQRDGLREAAAWKLAHEALPASHAYNWNQALMDLGAIICAAENPQCPECPAIEACLWRSSAISSGLSLRSVREPRTDYQAPDPGASRRRWRGRIIDALRAAQPDEFVSWPTIVASLPAGHESDGVNLNDLLTSLVNDGLAEREDADDLVRVRLPR
jgi:A/G-specific adenine glycosylase